MCASAHVGVEGNEMADKEEKQCLKRPEVELPVTIFEEEAKVIKAQHMSTVAKYIGERTMGSMSYCKTETSWVSGGWREQHKNRKEKKGHNCLSHPLHLIKKHDTRICRADTVNEGRY